MPTHALTAELYPQDTTNPANKLYDLDLASGLSYLTGERIDGNGSATLPRGEDQTASAAARAPRVVRVLHDGTPQFEFYVTSVSRDLSDESGGRVTVRGPGTRIVLNAAVVYPYGNCIPTESITQRVLGYQDPSFPTAGLPNVVSLGQFRRQQVDNIFTDDQIRAEGLADPFTEFISHTSGPADPGEALYFSPDFTPTADEAGTYVLQTCADDEHDAYLVGMLVASSRGKYRWKRVENAIVELCEGVTYRIVMRGNNLSTDNDGTEGNIHWVAAALVPAAADGKPESANEIHHLYVNDDVTGGTFSYRLPFSPTAITPDYNVSSSDLQEAIEAMPGVGVGNVDVSGAGSPESPFIIEYVGTLANSNLGGAIVSFSGLTGGSAAGVYSRVVEGDHATAIMRTDATWAYIAYPATPRGLTAGQMIRIVIEEAVARGQTVLSLVTWTFTDALDSDGNPWLEEYELPISPYSTKVSQVMSFLEMSGLRVEMKPGYVLHVSQTFGQDLTGTIDLTNAHLGQDTSFSLEKDIANVLLSETTEGTWNEAKDTSSIIVHGRWEEPYSAPEGPELTVGSWQRKALDTSAETYGEHRYITVSEAHPDGTTDPTPINDYDWGDTLTGPRILGGAGPVFVQAIGVRRRDDNAALEYITVVGEEL